MSQPVPIAFLWGDDAWGIEAAAEAFRQRTDLFPFGAPERWRVRGEDGTPARVLGDLRERLATGAMFGSGTMAVLSGVGVLTRRREDRDTLIATLGLIAPGNALVIAEETESGRKDPPHKPVVEAVRAAGGAERQFPAPRAGQLVGWIEQRARERGVALGAGAAQELATRVGAFVSEGDVDRRRQGQLAVMELEKLSLYRADGGAITPEDVKALTAEVIPDSMWAFVDAVGSRNADRALKLGEGILADQPGPVIIAVLHRRIRELLEIADRLQGGERPQDLPRTMKLNPYRAQTLVGQASRWTVAELTAALEGLLELDAMSKGFPGYPPGDAQHRLAFTTWLTETATRR